MLDDLEVDDSFGLAYQVGADIPIGEVTLFNIDVKYVDIDLDVSSDGSEIGTVEVDPWIIGFGIGRRW